MDFFGSTNKTDVMSCNNMDVSLIITGTATALTFKGIFCEEALSCSMIDIDITNKNNGTVTLEEVKCAEKKSCLDMDIDIAPLPGFVEIEKFICKEKTSCINCDVNFNDTNLEGEIDCAELAQSKGKGATGKAEEDYVTVECTGYYLFSVSLLLLYDIKYGIYGI